MATSTMGPVTAAPVTLPSGAYFSEVGVSQAYSTAVMGGIQLVNYTVDDTSPLLVYDGNWQAHAGEPTSEGLFNNTDHYTTDFGASVSLSFYGTACYLFSNGGATHGPATIVLDGRVVAQPSSFFTDDRNPFLLWAQAGLSLSMQHQVVVYQGTPQPPNLIQVDAFIITSNPHIQQPGGDSGVASVTYSVDIPGRDRGGPPGPNPGAIAGIVIGAVAAGALFSSLVWLFCRRRRRRRKAQAFQLPEKAMDDSEECIGRPYDSMGHDIGANTFISRPRTATTTTGEMSQIGTSTATWTTAASSQLNRAASTGGTSSSAIVTPFQLPANSRVLPSPAPQTPATNADVKSRILDATAADGNAPASNWVVMPGSRPRLEKLDMPSTVNRPPSPAMPSSSSSSNAPPRRRANSMPASATPLVDSATTVVAHHDPPPAYV